MNSTPSSQVNGVAAQPALLDPSNIGKVGVCSIGRAGVITDIKTLPWGVTYTGINVFNGTRWASRAPAIIANTLAEFLARCEQVAHRKGVDGRPLVEPPIYLLNSNLN